MIERIEQMPPGTAGLRASGELTREDYTEVLEPTLAELVAGEGIRLVFVLTDFHGLGHGAWVEDMKTGMRAWVRDHDRWRRFALVTDVEWVARAMRTFAWMAPGEVEVFDLEGLSAATDWVASG